MIFFSNTDEFDICHDPVCERGERGGGARLIDGKRSHAFCRLTEYRGADVGSTLNDSASG